MHNRLTLRQTAFITLFVASYLLLQFAISRLLTAALNLFVNLQTSPSRAGFEEVVSLLAYLLSVAIILSCGLIHKPTQLAELMGHETNNP